VDLTLGQPQISTAKAAASHRLAGLDTLRAAAIVLVFMYHYMVFVSHEPTFGLFSNVGWVGVDLFFVLSGFLIADQMMRGLVAGRELSLSSFYLRRWMRTFPAFWVVLAAYVLFTPELAGAPMPPTWRFLTFTQNLGLKPGTAFSHAWSLCIEEQFYLILPLVVLLGTALRAGRRAAWTLVVCLWLLGIVARTAYWFRYGTEATGQIDLYYTVVYYGTLCRFDEFLPGVALAMMRNLHPLVWQRLSRHGRMTLALAVAAIALMLDQVDRNYYIDDYGYGFFMSSLGYSLVALAFSVAVLSALSPSSPLARLTVPGMGLLARASYSIYLTHKAVGHVVGRIAAQHGWPATGQLMLVIIASLLVGWLLYVAVERPAMRLRDRLVTSNFRRADPALAPDALVLAAARSRAAGERQLNADS
jgi:peptidoglycan/LPS O-acetylase OafA/YrhL